MRKRAYYANTCVTCGQMCQPRDDGLCSACRGNAKHKDHICNARCKLGDWTTCRVLALVGAPLPCMPQDYSEAYSNGRLETGMDILTHARALSLVLGTAIIPIAWRGSRPVAVGG